MKHDDLNEIPPGPLDLEFALEPMQPGAFTNQLHMFVDDRGTREIVLTVNGTAAPAAKK